MRQIESKIQQTCKRWFDLQYPHLAPLLFAVPNGSYRNFYEAIRLKHEGVVRGVADMILLYNGALCIEFKTETGRQSKDQKRWEKLARKYGAEYYLVRDIDSFMFIINNYIHRKEPYDELRTRNGI